MHLPYHVTYLVTHIATEFGELIFLSSRLYRVVSRSIEDGSRRSTAEQGAREGMDADAAESSATLSARCCMDAWSLDISFFLALSTQDA